MTSPTIMPELGWQPLAFAVRLAPDTDFVSALVCSPDPWPDGVAITLEFEVYGDPVVWPATIVGTRASWAVPGAEVNAVLARPGLGEVRLRYTQPDVATLTWARGPVRVE